MVGGEAECGGERFWGKVGFGLGVGWSALVGVFEVVLSFGGGVDGEPVLVDGDVVVEPTDRDEIFWVGGSAFGPGGGVVDFDPIPTVAPGDLAVAVAPGEDGSS